MIDQTVYCTMVLTEDYVIGALVVAGELKRIDPEHGVVCIATPEHLSASSKEILEQTFEKVFYVEAIDAGNSIELDMLGRPKLRLAATKLRLWALPYRRVVYLDADTLPLRPLTALLETELPTSRSVAAAPDSGWPDMFNSGVMALKPDGALVSALQSKLSQSLDGSDQGVLNQELEWQRVPFLNNVTVSADRSQAAYEYLPAFRRFKSEINVLHFVGEKKPWNTDDYSTEATMWREAYYRNVKKSSPLSDQLNGQLSPSGTPLGSPTPEGSPIAISQLAAIPEPVYDENNIIKPPPDHWNPAVHAPFLNSRPEAQRIHELMKQLSVSELHEGEPLEEPTKHVFPKFGPRVSVLPFEHHQEPAERVFN